MGGEVGICLQSPRTGLGDPLIGDGGTNKSVRSLQNFLGVWSRRETKSHVQTPSTAPFCGAVKDLVRGAVSPGQAVE